MSFVSCREQVFHGDKHVLSGAGSSLLPFGEREGNPPPSQGEPAAGRPSCPGGARLSDNAFPAGSSLSWPAQRHPDRAEARSLGHSLHHCNGEGRAGTSCIRSLVSHSGGGACRERSDRSRNATVTGWRLCRAAGCRAADRFTFALFLRECKVARDVTLQRCQQGGSGLAGRRGGTWVLGGNWG